MHEPREGREAVIVVLGCAIRRRAALPAPEPAAARALRGAAGRRVEAAAAEYARMLRVIGTRDAGMRLVVIASGGRKWDVGAEVVVEADGLRDALALAGVPAHAVVRERCSFSTKENARYVARLARARGIEEVSLVTSAWHMARAAALFRAEGLRVREVPAEDAPVTGRFARAAWLVRPARRAWWTLRERASSWKDGVS